MDEWDVVCVNRDIAPDNFGLRESDQGQTLVTLDWGTAHLAPMEEDIEVVLGRLDIDREATKELLSHYLQTYAERTGHQIEYQAFWDGADGGDIRVLASIDDGA